MSTRKIQTLLQLAQEAGIDLSQLQAAKLIAKHPSKQASTIFKQEFGRLAKATGKAKAKPTATVDTVADPAKLAIAESATSVDLQASNNPDLSLSKTYNSIAACREQNPPAPIVVEYLGRNKEEFKIRSVLLDHALGEYDLIADYRYAHPAPSFIYDSAIYKGQLQNSQQNRRDHLSPREYCNDLTTDVQTLARKKRYQLTGKKLNAFVLGTCLKGNNHVIDFEPAEAIEYAQDLFADFEQVGFNAEQWAEQLAEESTSFQQFQRKLKMADWYFYHICIRNSGFPASICSFTIDDLEHQAYAFWMYDLLERHKLLGKGEQRYFRMPTIPSEGWEEFKKAGHKVLFFLDKIQVQDYTVNAILAFSTQTETILDYILFPEDAHITLYLANLCGNLNLTDLSFCGFFANSQVLDANELKQLDKIGIEYLISVHPFLIKYKTNRQWAVELTKPLYEQIKPLTYRGQVLLTAHALTQEEFSTASYKVNPDLTWLHKPLSELTLADSRPDLNSQQKPFCYIYSHQTISETHLREQWQEYLDLVEATDLTDAAAVVELKNNPYSKQVGDKIVLDYRDFSVLTRSLFITNVGQGNFISQQVQAESAAQSFIELATHYYCRHLRKAFAIDEEMFAEVARESGFAELNYEVAKDIFPEFFFIKLVTQQYYGEEVFAETISTFADKLGIKV